MTGIASRNGSIPEKLRYWSRWVGTKHMTQEAQEVMLVAAAVLEGTVQQRRHKYHSPKERTPERALQYLRDRPGERRSAKDLCNALCVSFESKNMQKALQFLKDQGLVNKHGNNRTSVYWVDA